MTEHEHELQEAIQRLRDSKVRLTPQRIAILEYLASVESHPTADEIYRHIYDKSPNISVATVYNNLKMLSEQGIIQEMTYGDDASRYDFNSGHHYHAVCQNCGKVVDLYYPWLDDVESAAEKLTGFKINGHRMGVFGLCPDCQRQLNS